MSDNCDRITIHDVLAGCCCAVITIGDSPQPTRILAVGCPVHDPQPDGPALTPEQQARLDNLMENM